jgi:hypothetical protein
VIVHSLYARDPGPQPGQTKLDDALDRGYNPCPDDMLPPPAHLTLDGDWLDALQGSVEEARSLSLSRQDSQPIDKKEAS